MITNQKYLNLGKLTQLVGRIVNGKALTSYAGKCIGPAWNFLPEDSNSLPEYVKVDWLNLGCTIYNRKALNNPPFQNHFTGYSMMEDLTLSLTVGKNWKLYNVRNAKIYHDSQPGAHKNNIYELSKMEIKNRHYVMTRILEKSTAKDYLKLLLLETFFISSNLKTFSGIKQLPLLLAGKFAGVFSILKGKR